MNSFCTFNNTPSHAFISSRSSSSTQWTWNHKRNERSLSHFGIYIWSLDIFHGFNEYIAPFTIWINLCLCVYFLLHFRLLLSVWVCPFHSLSFVLCLSYQFTIHVAIALPALFSLFIPQIFFMDPSYRLLAAFYKEFFT